VKVREKPARKARSIWREGRASKWCGQRRDRQRPGREGRVVHFAHATRHEDAAIILWHDGFGALESVQRTISRFIARLRDSSEAAGPRPGTLDREANDSSTVARPSLARLFPVCSTWMS